MDDKELWVRFAEAAIGRYVLPEDLENAEEVADDMADIATNFADAMMEEYEKRHGAAGKPARRRGKKDPDDE